MMLKGKISTSVADTLTRTEDEDEGRDTIFKLVISNLSIITNWVEFYGLNITDTMKLDFGAYHLMLHEIQEYNKMVKQATKDAKDEITKNLPNME